MNTTEGPGGRVLVHRPTFAEREPRRHRRRRRAVDLGLAFGVPTALIGLWQLAASQSWIDPRLYPSPSDVVTRIDDLVRDGDLLHDLWVSMQRIVLGYLIGAGGAVAVGLAMGASRSLRSALEPLLTALYTVPKLALIPVFVTIFGFGRHPSWRSSRSPSSSSSGSPRWPPSSRSPRATGRRPGRSR